MSGTCAHDRERGETMTKLTPSDIAKDSDYWSVTVSRGGEHIVTIEPQMLTGREISEKDEAAIRESALNLLSFIGSQPAREPSDSTVKKSLTVHPSEAAIKAACAAAFKGSCGPVYIEDALRAAYAIDFSQPTP